MKIYDHNIWGNFSAINSDKARTSSDHSPIIFDFEIVWNYIVEEKTLPMNWTLNDSSL